MFTTTIDATPFTRVEVPPFDRIDGKYGDFCGDTSFTSTLRALLAPRMQDGDILHIRTQSFDRCSGVTIEQEPNSFIIYYCGDNYNRESYFLNASDIYSKSGFEKIEVISKFFEKVVKVECYIDRGRKICVLICWDLNLLIWHFLQAASLAYFPWYFDGKKDTVTDAELALMQSFRSADASQYIQAINELARISGVRELMINECLKNFEESKNNQQLASLESSTRSLNRRLNELSREMQDIYRQLRENRIKTLGLQQLNSTGDNEVLNYFLAHPQFDVIGNSDTDGIIFVVSDTCVPDPPASIEPYIDNPRGYVVTERGAGDMSCGKMRRLLRAIFVDKTLKLKLCAAYRISPDGFSPISGFTFDTRYTDFLPNPHIQRYACTGAYSGVINDAIGNNDYCYALEQCIGSVRSINFGDIAVMRDFMRKLYSTENHTKKFIELPDGSRATIPEALAYLGNKSNEEEENE